MVGSIVKTYESQNLSQIIDFPYVICPYIIWLSVELNLVMIVASVPLLRPLFRRYPNNPHDEPKSKWETITLGSVLPKSNGAGGSRGAGRRMSTASEEYIMTPQGSKSGGGSSSTRTVDFGDGEGGDDGGGAGVEHGGITRTTEVSVTYESSDKPFVHAALVGLVQGEIQNPGIARR